MPMTAVRRPFPTRALLLLAVFSATIASAATITPRLQHVLDAPDHAAWREDQRVGVWVMLEASRPSATALRRAEAGLAPRALARRAKVTPPGRELVDVRDVPIDPARLARLDAVGAERRVVSRWLRAVTYLATPAQVAVFAKHPDVRAVDLLIPRNPRRAVESKELPLRSSKRTWSIDYGQSQPFLELIGVPAVHELGFTGAGVVVGMLDTGFHFAHESLDHVPVLAAYDFVGDDTNVDFEPGDAPGSHHHGTQVASAVFGHQPGELVGPAIGASAILARAERIDITEPVLEEDWWIAGLEFLEAQGADIVQSSLGRLTDLEFALLDGDTYPSTIAADLATARGVVVVQAAGNQGGLAFEHIVVPADADSVISVGSVDPDGSVSSFSSPGPTADGRIKPDVVAPGSQIPVPDPDDDHAYTTAGGTSMAAPYVAGVAALLLERMPFLTPMQVREALRETASHPAVPDNSRGWGLIDALAALHYWGPRFTHTPHPHTEDDVGPYDVSVTVVDAWGLDATGPQLNYRVDGGAWQQVAMAPSGTDHYVASIPGQTHDSSVEYWFEAIDVRGLSTRHPLSVDGEVFAFEVMLDDAPPTIVHSPLPDLPIAGWPPAVSAVVTDALAVETVTVTFAVNGAPASDPVRLTRGLHDVYAVELPIPNANPGDVVAYTIDAIDTSQATNHATAGPFTFEVLAGAGSILVLDDTAGRNEAADVASWLGTAGYTVLSKSIHLATAADFTGKQAVVVLCGNNENPMGFPSHRALLVDWIDAGGRLLVEGGELGFAIIGLQADPGFTTTVLHGTSWEGDNVGVLEPVASATNHPLLRTPSTVVTPLAFSGADFADQDAIGPAPDALLVLKNAGRRGTGGAIVFDDAAIDPAAQVVYLPFALGALADQASARALVENAVHLLLDRGMPTSVEPTDLVAHVESVRPNPFAGVTTIRLRGNHVLEARVEVFDVRGRRVRTLPAKHVVTWDGRDDAGRPVSSGTYFVSVRSTKHEEHVKVVLVR